MNEINEIRELLRSGKKLQAIKLFMDTFHCSLKEAKATIEEIQTGRVYQWSYYKQKYDRSGSANKNRESGGNLDRNDVQMYDRSGSSENYGRDDARVYVKSEAAKSQKDTKGCVIAFICLFAIVAVVVLPFLFNFTNIIMPTLNFQTVAVELEGGEVFEVPFIGHMKGAETRSGEYLIEYDVKELAKFAALYTAPFYDTREYSGWADLPTEGWEIRDNANPWFAGSIHETSKLLGSYCKSEMVFHSPSDYHYEDELYDKNGNVIWSYDSREKLRGEYTQRTTIGFSRRGSGGNLFDFIFPNCINIHQFLAEYYGIEVESVYDKKNMMMTFRVPREAIVLYEE